MKRLIVSKGWFAKIRSLLTSVFGGGNKGGDCGSTIPDDTETIVPKPNRIPAWFYRGKDWSSRGEQDRAIEDYTEAIRLDPNYVNAFIGRGISWGEKGEEKGEYDKAVADFDEALRIDPDNRHAIRNRATAMSTKYLEG